VFLCRTLNEHSATRTLSHYRCDVCGSVFVGESIADRELLLAYSTLDARAYYEEIAEQNLRRLKTAVQYLARLLRGRSGEILDIGAGDGRFLALLRDSGFTHVSAHEIPCGELFSLAGALTQIYRDFDYATIPSSKFDVVTLMDVLEHVPRPADLVLACARILRPGGMIYLRTPVVTRLDSVMHAFQRMRGLQALGRAWQRGRTSCFHLQNYTPRALEALLVCRGFERVDVRVVNELSWPLGRCVRVYLVDKYSVPPIVGRGLTPLLYPFLCTRFFNANKAVLTARRA